MPHDMWHWTLDTWHMTGVGRWTFSQKFSSLALMVWEWYKLEENFLQRAKSWIWTTLPIVLLILAFLILWRRKKKSKNYQIRNCVSAFFNCVSLYGGSLKATVENPRGSVENPEGALTLPRNTVTAPEALSWGDSFSTLPQGFSTVVQTTKIMRFTDKWSQTVRVFDGVYS